MSDLPGPIASCLFNIGLAARALGDYDRAERALSEALEVATCSGNAVFIGNSATSLGYVMLARGELARARSLLCQGLNVLAPIGNPTWTASALSLAAAIAATEGDNRTAARLWGAVDALLNDAGASFEGADELARESFEPGVRSALGSSEFRAAAEGGRQMTVEQALRLGLTTAAADDSLPPAA